MVIEAKGKVNVLLPKRTGVGKTGNEWASQDVVIETETDNPEYRKFFMFNIFGQNKIDEFALKVGDEVAVTCNAEAKEYGGKWFNQISVFKVYKSNSGKSINHYEVSAQPAKRNEPESFKASNTDEDMPF